MDNFDSNYLKKLLEELYNFGQELKNEFEVKIQEIKQELKKDLEAEFQTLKEELRKEINTYLENEIQNLRYELKEDLRKELFYKMEAIRASYDLYTRMSGAVNRISTSESVGHYRRKGNGIKTTKVEWVEEPEW